MTAAVQRRARASRQLRKVPPRNLRRGLRLGAQISHLSPRRTRSIAAALLLLACAWPRSLGAVALQEQTVVAFDAYIAQVEEDFAQRLAGELQFLWSAESEARTEVLREGKVLVEPATEDGSVPIHAGLIHDWISAVLIPGTAVERVVDVVTAYDTHATTYAPAVQRSRILERAGPRFRVSMRMRRKQVLTVVLDTEHAAEFDRLDSERWWGLSRSTSVREVRKAGTPQERLRPEGRDHGFLWRLNAYWRFAQTDAGVVAEYRTITLTRSIPHTLRKMLRPILTALPRQSMRGILQTTRSAALGTALGAVSR